MSLNILGKGTGKTDFYLNWDVKDRDAMIKESEAKYRLIADHASDMISIIDPDSYCYTYVSPSYEKVLDCKAEEVLGQDCMEVIHPDDRAAMQEVLLKGIQEGFGLAQYRIQKKDGTIIWVETSGKIIEADEIFSGILFISRDISERQRMQETLCDQLNYMNTLIHNMNELCYTVDLDYRLTFANQKAVQVSGYSLEERIGKSVLDFVPASDQEGVRQEIRKHLDDGETSIHEHSFIRKDGSELLLREKSAPIIENGKVIGVVALAEDITQQRKIEKEMARLEQMNMVAEIAASIAHEIRNPMTTVQGFLQIMRQKYYMQEDKNHIDLMLEELGRANYIITEFLSLAKNKVIDLHYQNLNSIVENMASLLLAEAVKRNNRISFKLGSIPDLLLDEKEISQLIINLVRNGLEAMQTGGTIIVKTYQDTGGIVLAVQDEGTGIAPEIKKHLGTPFLSGKENGIGLGLAVCYSIVERHSASIDYDTGSAGTTFRVRFTENP